MKIVHIGPRFYPIAGQGGLENALRSIAMYQAQDGHDVTVLCASGSYIPGVTCVGLAEPRVHRSEQEYEEMVRAQARAAFEFIRDNPSYDVGHDHTGAFATYAHRLDVPVVSTLHNGVEQGLLFTQGNNRNITYVTVSHDLRERFDVTPLNVQYVVYPDVDCTPLLSMAQPRREPVLCSLIASMKPNKGPDLSIRVVLALREQGFDYKLRIAGDAAGGEWETWFESNVSHYFDGDIVEFFGRVDGLGKQRLFESASGFLMLNRSYLNPYMPAWHEPFGIVTVEAMAAGLPVVGVAEGATGEVAGPAGIILPAVDDETTIGEAVSAVQRLGTISAETCRGQAQLYLPGTAARQYLAIYLGLLD